MISATIATLALLFATAHSYTTVKFPSRTNDYTLNYQVLSSGNAIRFNLSATGIDTSTWVSGKSGLWFGIGFGNNQMKNIDFNWCTFAWKNATTDAFACVDSYFDANRSPLAPS